MPKYKYASLTYIQTTQTIHKNPSRITNHSRRHPFIPVPPVLVPIAQQFVTNQQPNPHDTQILQPTQHPHNTYTTQYNLPYTLAPCLRMHTSTYRTLTVPFSNSRHNTPQQQPSPDKTPLATLPAQVFFRPSVPPPGSFKCGKNCYTCNYIADGTTSYTFSQTGLSRTISSHLDCNTRNLIYMIHCTKCGKQYIGETRRRLRDRFNEHRRPVDRPSS